MPSPSNDYLVAEIKKIVRRPSGYKCDFSEDMAEKIVKIGFMQNHGGEDFDLCNNPECIEQAFDAYAEFYVKYH